MGDSGDRKRSKKSKRSKRSKKNKLPKDSRQTAPSPVDQLADQPDADEELVLSEASQMVVIEMQRTELTRLLREQQRLNDRVDQLLQLHEREQVLRQQMQAALDNLTAQRALPPPHQGEAHHEHLVERVSRAEGKFTALQSAVGMLVAALERQTASA
jgi:hypothetical protein